MCKTGGKGNQGAYIEHRYEPPFGARLAEQFTDIHVTNFKKTNLFSGDKVLESVDIHMR